MSERRLAIQVVSACVIALAGLIGCDRKQPSTPSPSPTAPPTQIRLIGEAYAPLEALDALKGKFEAESGIKVEIVRKSHQEVVDELSQELASGRPSYDLILMPHRLLGRFVEKRQVVPIDEMLREPEFSAGAIPESDLFDHWVREISWYKGRQYGYPFTALTMYMIYRTDLFEDASEKAAFRERYKRELSPPRTWQEYAEVAEFFHRPEKGLNGTYINGQQHVALWYEWLNFIYSFGGNILDSDTGSERGPVVVDSEQNVRATEFYVSLLRYSPPESRNYNWDDALASMQQGRCALGLMWSDSVPFLEDATQSKVAGKIGYGLVPTPDGRGTAQLEGWTYLIPTESKNPRAALTFMLWAMRKDVQVAQMVKGGASPRRSTYDQPEVQAIPYVPTFLQVVPIAVPKPTIPESGEMTERAVRHLSQILAGKPVKTELAELAAEYRQLLKSSESSPPGKP
jgi:multiple sugar transport system substrate-binding protein